MVVTVITPTIRPAGAIEAVCSVQTAMTRVPDLEVHHVLAYWPGEPNGSRERVAPWLTRLIAQAAPGWLCFLDDDNRMHPEFLAVLVDQVARHPDARAFLFAMDYPQFPGGVLMPSLPPTPGHVDGGQMALERDYATLEPWPLGGYGDGWYLHQLYQRDPAAWRVVPQVVTAHNHQRRVPPLVPL